MFSTSGFLCSSRERHTSSFSSSDNRIGFTSYLNTSRYSLSTIHSRNQYLSCYYIHTCHHSLTTRVLYMYIHQASPYIGTIPISKLTLNSLTSHSNTDMRNSLNIPLEIHPALEPYPISFH